MMYMPRSIRYVVSPRTRYTPVDDVPNPPPPPFYAMLRPLTLLYTSSVPTSSYPPRDRMPVSRMRVGLSYMAV